MLKITVFYRKILRYICNALTTNTGAGFRISYRPMPNGLRPHQTTDQQEIEKNLSFELSPQKTKMETRIYTLSLSHPS
jgi:hypothetical protein